MDGNVVSCYLESIEEFVFTKVWARVFVVYRVDGTIGVCVYVSSFCFLFLCGDFPCIMRNGV